MNNNSGNFLVGTIDEGITNNTKPWATPADSWESLINVYQWRGRVVKKTPYTLVGQLSFVVTSQVVAASAQNFTANLFAVFGLAGVTIVPSFTTITVSGGANYTLIEDKANPGSIIYSSGANAPAFLNGSINYLTGDLALNFTAPGPPAGNVVITFSYAYGLPVMGLRTRELFELNDQATIGFDTVYSYIYSTSLKQFIPLPSVMPTIWSGTNSQFFFTTNYAGSFWATNSKPGLHGVNISGISNANPAVVTTTVPHLYTTGQTVAIINVTGYAPLATTTPILNGQSFVITVTGANTFTIPLNGALYAAYGSGGIALNSYVSQVGQDGIRYYGTLTNGTGWANYNPPVNPNNALVGALLIFPYRGYLVFLNTTEGNEVSTYNYGNRARWTQIGTPYYSEPVPTLPNPQTVDINAARDDLFGRGGFTNAPTQEVIIGAAFVRDILVVFFERSCWRLRFVNNTQNPFVWERINVELGSSATFSTIPFDKGAMAIGERGIVIADSNDVIRLDDKIPDTIFDIRIANQGMQRVYGIRTFRTRLNYWTMPSAANESGIYPDLVLVYNYETKTWAMFDDCFTCFGYFYEFSGLTWADLTQAWSNYDGDEYKWGNGSLSAGFENIIAGNQQGFVLKLEGKPENTNDNANFQNGASLMIDAIVNGTPSTFTSQDNNLPDGSWIVLSGVSGTTSSDGVSLNGRSFKVINPGNAASNFTLQEWRSYAAGNATGGSFTFTLASPYIPIFPGSVNIQVGSLKFTDPSLDGVLTTGTASTGTINYQTGAISLTFSPAIGATPVYIRVVSQNPAQGLANVETIGTYTGGGFISKTSNFQLQTKFFNFLDKDQRARLNRIDFYLNRTTAGEFQADIYADSSNQVINSPLSDNLRSNIVRTVKGQYQYGDGPQTIYRLYAQAQAQTIQVSMGLNDSQIAVPSIASSDLEILALNFSLRSAGRLI